MSGSFARRAYSVAAIRKLARRRLPGVVFDFVDGAAEDEVVMRRNEAAFDEIALLPRPLNGAPTRDQSIELFGERLTSPVLIGPTGMAGLLRPRGEILAAQAAAAAGTVYTMSHGAAVSLEDVVLSAGGKLWMQIFPYRDRSLSGSFIQRARAAGCRALILTVDNQMLGQRERDVRNGFTIPPRLTFANLVDMAWHWRWLLAMALGPKITMANYAQKGLEDLATIAARVASWVDPGTGWEEVEWMRSQWEGPFLLKGILHPEEARRAVALGVDGIVVSNHGGRQLDVVPASIEALPAVVEAVGGAVPVLIDGGIRRGGDVVKALALGASACLIARPYLWGLAAAGQEGVARVLQVFRAEIDRVMGLCGWDRIADIDRSALFSKTSPLMPAVAAPRKLSAV
jgi:isopentenyl diphosphate isomerase/L-lactate dehydrogenase-like FMN-dependent dehydrogenase